MSGNNYDFVGISSSQLPYIHASFPATAAGPKYYTMRSVYRGRDADRKRDLSLRQSQAIGLKTDNKVIADLKLPTLDLELDIVQKPTSRVDPLNPLIHPSGNINKQKAYYKLKGIYLDKVYSVNRAKKTATDDRSSTPTKPEGRLNRTVTRKSSVSSRKSNATLPIVNFKLPSINSTSERFSETRTPGAHSVKSAGSSSEYRSKLRDMDREASPIPGIKPKRIYRGRKLGNVVSSQRLHQLLAREDTLDPGSFFFF